MTFLVLIWAVFLMFSITTSDPITDTNYTSKLWYTFINSTNLAKPGCDSRCGDLIVPYPFGIGDNPGCYINDEFRIYCDTLLKATIDEGGNYPIKFINDSTIRLSNKVARWCYSPDGAKNIDILSMNFRKTPYTLSNVNKFTAIGCDSNAFLTTFRKERLSPSNGCMVYCPSLDEVVSDGIKYYGTDISYQSTIESRTWALPYTYAFVGEENVFNFNVTDLNDTNLKKRIEDNVPIVLDWAIGSLSCSEAIATECKSNSICVNSARKGGGYRCECERGYEGNPYMDPGCQDINECDRKKDFPCYGTCHNTPGNYTCKCKTLYTGDPNNEHGCRVNALGLWIGIGIGFLALLTGLSVFNFLAKKRKIAKLREKFYERNGGMLLEEKLKTTGGMGVGFMKVFQYQELKEATDNYAEDRILGRGGNGIVYKGTLSDMCVVAIKKSQRLDEG